MVCGDARGSQSYAPPQCYSPYSPCLPPCPPSPLLFRASVLQNVPLTPGTPSPLAFPQVTVANQYYSTVPTVPPTSAYTAPVAGTYVFTASVTWATALPAAMFTLYLQKNGVNTGFAASTMANGVGSYVTAVTACIPVAAADVVTFAAASTQPVTIQGGPPCPSPLSFFQGQVKY